MDFFSIILFLGLYYIRPHEWIGFVGRLRPIQLCMWLALFSLFHHHRALNWRNYLQTPHDWFMAVYFLWIVEAGPSFSNAWGAVSNLFVFYAITVVTLTSIQRLQSFLNWWTLFIMALALMALGGEYGFDLTGSYDITHGVMKERLILNTSIFRNPNALAHSVVPVVMMLYFVGFWQRPVFTKVATSGAMLLPLYCVWLAVSKGAFLSGFATICLGLGFKRPKAVQIIILILAATIGWTFLIHLPRMEELSQSTTDRAIQGRKAAFRFGWDAMNAGWRGIGVKTFERAFYQANRYFKAPHSSYVCVGAELGKPGLYLFVGVLYCCLRTLFQARTRTKEEERARRILFVLVVSYMVSSWMVGWSDRPTFFLMAAATGALHRQLLGPPSSQAESHLEGKGQPVAILSMRPFQTFPLAAQTTLGADRLTVPIITTASPVETRAAGVTITTDALAIPQPGISWKRVGWLDLLLVFLMTEATLWYWHHHATTA